MNNLFFKLDNTIQNYSWGSHTSIHDLFGIDNPTNEPQAEIWMGTHPNGCSKLADTKQLLSDVINQNKTQSLGNYTTARFGELPFLFKVLAAESPLSIQVHPSKHKAEIGFARENEQGIPLDAANRNYKDPNHKPELVYALTFYKAMNGFRPIEKILSLFEQTNITALGSEINKLKATPNSDGLRVFFSAIMSLEGDRKQQALNELYASLERPAKTAMAREAYGYIKDFRQHYADDIGLFSPLMLNTIELAPGEAMFLHAETPHAYVQGTGLEIMANSDNVLRAGLTPKYIDVTELIDNTIFNPIDPKQIKLAPVHKEDKLSYPIPVDDFGFEVITVKESATIQFVRSAEILFCIEGEITVSNQDVHITLKAGESVFVSNMSLSYSCQGRGTLARAFN
ncbi:mannose-6-phosphate isomerase, class I [Vibrio parahaemolyticus]|uniref:mannose-6-phosphate isomerase, class I n=1 Tax=Vibrio parahaemolyticus TaxID=670 RepID=UPI0028F4363B|nr:mannose-6-phosphate isomerase, class I [Vibrio parahaemolyticus]WMP07284.1 mannose-6-phosphate isomerase, class I [Vibrio parahaemolyticus]